MNRLNRGRIDRYVMICLLGIIALTQLPPGFSYDMVYIIGLGYALMLCLEVGFYFVNNIRPEEKPNPDNLICPLCYKTMKKTKTGWNCNHEEKKEGEK